MSNSGLSEYGKAIYILSVLKDKIGLVLEHLEEDKVYVVYKSFDFDVDYKATTTLIIRPSVGTKNKAIDAIAELLTIMYCEVYHNEFQRQTTP